MQNKWKLWGLLIIMCPGVWQIGMQAKSFLAEWVKLPQEIVESSKSKVHDGYPIRLVELRWGGAAYHRNDVGSKILYSKFLWVENNVFDWIEFATPRLYFLTGDGGRFSPTNVEPIPSILFPFWLAGVLYLIREKRYRPIIALGLGAGLGYAAGIKNMAVLFPVLLTQIYISVIGITLLKEKKWYGVMIGTIAIYSIFTVDMTLYGR